MPEEWRSIVRSVDRWYVRANGHRQFRRGRVLKPTMAGTGRSKAECDMWFEEDDRG